MDKVIDTSAEEVKIVQASDIANACSGNIDHANEFSGKKNVGTGAVYYMQLWSCKIAPHVR